MGMGEIGRDRDYARKIFKIVIRDGLGHSRIYAKRRVAKRQIEDKSRKKGIKFQEKIRNRNGDRDSQEVLKKNKRSKRGKDLSK